MLIGIWIVPVNSNYVKLHRYVSYISMLENDEYIIPCNFGGRIANGFGSNRGRRGGSKALFPGCTERVNGEGYK